MKIMGIDPSLSVTGYGLISVEDGRPQIVEAGVIRTDRRRPLPERLLSLYEESLSLFRETEPDVVVLENLYSHYARPTTAILMGHARGVLMLAARSAGIGVVSYASTKVKSAVTGSGRASKAQMQRMIKSAFGLPELPKPPDVADAIALALCQANLTARPRLRFEGAGR